MDYEMDGVLRKKLERSEGYSSVVSGKTGMAGIFSELHHIYKNTMTYLRIVPLPGKKKKGVGTDGTPDFIPKPSRRRCRYRRRRHAGGTSVPIGSAGKWSPLLDIPKQTNK